MTRLTGWLGLGVLILTLSGCLIDSPSEESGFLSVVRIRPDYNLQAAPPGYCYQMWILDVNSFDNPTELYFIPLIRFQWDPVNFRTLDETGQEDIPLYTQEGNGIDVGVNFLDDHYIVLLSIEPVDDPNPDVPNGPLISWFIDPSPITGQQSTLRVNKSGEMRLDFFGPGVVPLPGQGNSSVSIVAQSLQHQRQEHEYVCWRDETEGFGIWFAQTEVRDLEVQDTVGFSVDPADTAGKGTVFTREINDNPSQDQIEFTIWIFPDHPESSVANFDDVFPRYAPDLDFRDGDAQRAGSIIPPDDLGMHPYTLDAERNVIELTPDSAGYAEAIGYMYFSDGVDTCFLRVDHPDSSYCTSDSPQDTSGLPYYVGEPFADTNLLIRRFVTTWADTNVTPSLLGLPPHQLDLGLEYEAWLIFDSLNAELKPLSLGRFSPDLLVMDNNVIVEGAQQLDSSNPYTLDTLDRNFNVPGEDFLQNLPEGYPEPLNVFDVPNVTRTKLWITMEPASDPFSGTEDWDPDQPYTQFLTYVVELVPETDMDTLVCDRETIPEGQGAPNPPPSALNYPLLYHDPVTAEWIDLAEGHSWPRVMFFLSSPFEEPSD